MAQGWAAEVVDASDGSGFFSALAFNPISGFPAIAYSASPGRQEQVRLAEWNGASWSIQVVAAGRDVAESAMSLAFDASGNPGVSFCSGGLNVARRSGSTWSSQIVDSKGSCTAPLGYAGGTYWVAYTSAVKNGSVLKLAHLVGSSWSSEVVDGSGMSYLALAFAPDGNPSLAYRSGTGTSTLKFAHKTGSNWNIQSVGTGTYYGVFTSLAYDPLSGNPTISHSNGTELRFHRWDGSQWVLETAATGTCSYSSLAYDAAGVAAISYNLFIPASNGYRQLRLARRTGCSGTCWEDQLVDDVTPLVLQWRTSLAFAPTGAASISYGLYSPQILKFAQQTP